MPSKNLTIYIETGKIGGNNIYYADTVVIGPDVINEKKGTKYWAWEADNTINVILYNLEAYYKVTNIYFIDSSGNRTDCEVETLGNTDISNSELNSYFFEYNKIASNITVYVTIVKVQS